MRGDATVLAPQRSFRLFSCNGASKIYKDFREKRSQWRDSMGSHYGQMLWAIIGGNTGVNVTYIFS